MPRRIKKNRQIEPSSAPTRGRTQIVVLSLLFALCFGVGLSYHVFEWSTRSPASTVLSILYEAVLLVGFGSLALVLNDVFSSHRSSPARSLWAVVVTGMSTLSLGAIVSRLGGNPGVPGFDLETGVPLALASIFKMNILALALITFSIVLLIKLQDLVLVKRTKSSQRNWYVMLGAMVLASLTVLANDAGQDLSDIQTVALIIVVVFMLVNAFRLSWIVFLSFREKVATIGLCLVLGMLLLLGFGLMGEGPLTDAFISDGSAYMEFYSPSLSLFMSQATMFGILYCTTSFLSLLFHLPTSSEFKQRAGERAAMQSLSHMAGHVFGSDNLYSTITSAPLEAGSASASWLALPNVQTGSLKPILVACQGIELDRIKNLVDTQALYEEVFLRREPIHLDYAPADHRVNARPGDGLGSLYITPLMARDKMLGALFVAKNVVHGFERDDLQTIGIFAAQAAVSMDNAQLFEQQVEKERLARELSIAREVQKRLLPQKNPTLDGLSIAASSVSALEVGGDYYDFVELDDSRLAVIIGDVSGKGTSAAFYMAEMQGIFQSMSRVAPFPREFLTHANTALAHSLDRNVFISVIYGILDIEKEQFTLARAGHCPAAVVDQLGNARFVRSRGMGLGLDRSDLFRLTLDEETINLSPGDVFALYTDGVVESRSPEEEEYGYDRLLRVLSEQRHNDAERIHQLVLDDLNQFLQDREYDDDMTLVIIKWDGLSLANSSSLVETRSEPTLS